MGWAQDGDVQYWIQHSSLREISVPWWMLRVGWTAGSDRCFPCFQYPGDSPAPADEKSARETKRKSGNSYGILARKQPISIIPVNFLLRCEVKTGKKQQLGSSLQEKQINPWDVNDPELSAPKWASPKRVKGFNLKDSNPPLSFDLEFLAKNFRNAFPSPHWNPPGSTELSRRLRGFKWHRNGAGDGNQPIPKAPGIRRKMGMNYSACPERYRITDCRLLSGKKSRNCNKWNLPSGRSWVLGFRSIKSDNLWIILAWGFVGIYFHIHEQDSQAGLSFSFAPFVGIISGGITIPEGISNPCGCGTWGHGGSSGLGMLGNGWIQRLFQP